MSAPTEVDRTLPLLPGITIADVAVVVGALVLATAGLWAMQDALIDDVFITLGYARNLAEHGEWGILPGIPANTATSVLNVLVLGAVTMVVRDPMAALWLVTALNAAALAVGLLRLGSLWGVGRWLAYVGAPLLLLNPLLVSSIGMETMLTVTLLVWLLERAQAGSVAGFGWLSGLAVLLRADLVVVVAVVWMLHPGLRQPTWLRPTTAIAWRAALLCTPWFLWSWIHFGSAIPDTLALKQRQTWSSFPLGWWARYHPRYPEATEAVTIIAGLGVVACVALPLLARIADRSPVLSIAAAPLAGAAYFALFWVLDVPPYFWYYGLTLAGLTLVLAWAVGVLAHRDQGDPLIARWKLVGGVAAAAMAIPGAYVMADLLSDHAPLREAPIHGNWALTPQYKQIGLDLRQRLGNDVVIRSSGEFGTIQYYCECVVLDRFSDRSLIVPALEKQRDSSWLMKLNYAWFDGDDYSGTEQDYHLSYDRRHVDETLHPDMWNVFSPTRGTGHYELVPGPLPRDEGSGVTR